MTYRNFRQDIEEAADGEPILHVVIGMMGWGEYGATDKHKPGLARKGEILTWDEAKSLLDYDYDVGYGAPDCQAVHVWTANKVLFVSQYDGSTSVESVHRYPSTDLPNMPGG